MTNDKLQAYLFDDIQVELRTFKVSKSGRDVQLEPKTLKLLIFLIENKGRLIEKGEMLDAVWKDTNVTENALTREIAKLRRMLDDNPKRARYIQTVHTRGYRFVAEVEVRSIETNGNHDLDTSGETKDRADAVIAGNGSQNGLPAITPALAAPQITGVPPAASKKANALSVFQYATSSALMRLIVTLSIFTIAILLAWKFYLEPGLATTPIVGEIMPVTTAPHLDLNPTFSPDGNSLAYSSDRRGNSEIYARPLSPGGREIQLTSDDNQNLEPAWSPDGDFIAYHSSKRGGIWLIPALGGVARQLTEFGCHPSWSRDGSMLAFQSESFHDMLQPYASSGTIWVIPAEGGEPRQVTEGANPPGGHLFPSWSPNGKRIAFLNANMQSMQIWSVSAAGDGLKQLTPHGTDDKADVVYSPDGESIFYTAGMMLFKLPVAPDTGDPTSSPVKVADLGSTVLRHPAFSPDGGKIAYSAWTVKSNVWSLPVSPHTHGSVGPAVALTNELNSRNGLTAFSPDGRRIAFTSMHRGRGYQIWLMDADGQNLTQLTTDAQAALLPCWYPSGDQIAFYCMRADNSTLSSIAVESRKEKVLARAEGLEGLRLSPDAKQVAFNYAPDSFFNIGVMTTEGEQLQQLTFEKTFTGFPCWSPNGKLLAYQMKRGDDMQIMLLPSSGGAPTQLTFGSGDKWPYSWSPDGDKIAFAGSRNGVWNVMWISLSDRTEKQLTNNSRPGVIIRFPDWSPLGNQIVYEQAEITGNINVMSLK